jgi:DNA-binding CsgD family transcriptional regulator
MMQPETVTPREIEIVKMIAEGLNSREISFQLFISEHTVHTHRRNIVKKLGVRNVAHLVHYSWQRGLFNKLNKPTLEYSAQLG